MNKSKEFQSNRGVLSMKVILFIFCILFFWYSILLSDDNAQKPLFSEEYHVQSIVEAYQLIRLIRYGGVSNVPEMLNYIDWMQSGSWDEDSHDIVYGYKGVCDWKVTLTHFWRADLGDNHRWEFYSGEWPNAYMKARKMVHSGLTYPFPAIDNGYYNSNPFVKGSWVSYKHNLFETYNNKDYIVLNDKEISTVHRHMIIYDILGRLCHLIADMSVPAHAHNDAHGLNKDIWENIIVNNSLNGRNAQTALAAGGIFKDIEKKNDPLRYIFYTTNQIADYYPSISTTWLIGIPDEYILPDAPGNQRYVNTYNGDYYAELDDFYTHSYGRFREIENYKEFQLRKNEMKDVLLNLNIRAQASMLYWFAHETGLLDRPVKAEYIFGPRVGWPKNVPAKLRCTISGGNPPYSFIWLCKYEGGDSNSNPDRPQSTNSSLNYSKNSTDQPAAPAPNTWYTVGQGQEITLISSSTRKLKCVVYDGDMCTSTIYYTLTITDSDVWQ